VHAQERYFEMDLMRSAAGELSALFGPKAIDADKRMRVHRLRARTEANMQAALGDNVEAVSAYVGGVNEGLADLSVRPWAYLLLRQSPQPWQASDSVLTGLAMYADLQDPGNQTELALSRIRAVVPPALYALIAHDGTEWDAPLFGEPTGNAALPDASQLDLRTLKGKSGTEQEEADVIGSNNFAVAGRSPPTVARSSPTTCTWPARAGPVVPRAPALPRPAGRRRPGRRHRLLAARPAGGDRRQQRARRLGLHQQLHRHGGLPHGTGQRRRDRA
jgi:acyl-homoserine lactone acylase PvdQ